MLCPLKFSVFGNPNYTLKDHEDPVFECEGEKCEWGTKTLKHTKLIKDMIPESDKHKYKLKEGEYFIEHIYRMQKASAWQIKKHIYEYVCAIKLIAEK